LRRTQQADALAASSDTVLAIREEQQKLAKQMRIQNKAKFVSKRTKDGITASDDQALASSHDSLRVADTTSAADKTKELNEIAQPILPSSECEAIVAISSESELREVQKQVMVEKRKLRLETLQGGGENSAEIKHQLDILAAKDALIQRQINVVVKKEPALNKNASATGSEPSSSNARGVNYGALQGKNRRAKDVFEEAETILRKVNEALSGTDRRRAAIGDDGPGPQPLVIIELQISNLLNRMPDGSENDPVGYRGKLVEALQKIDVFKKVAIEAGEISFNFIPETC
jgi:hypothetical protein